MTALESTCQDQWRSLVDDASTKPGPRPALIPLPSLSVLQVEGEDAESFLQSQLSADLRTLTPDNWIRASYCSPKGRVLAVLTLWRKKNAILTALPTEIIGTILQRLSLYKLRSRVELSVQHDLLVAGLAQTCWPQWCSEQNITPPELGQSNTDNPLGIDVLAISEQRALLCAPAKSFSALRASIQPSLAETDWWRACIDDQEAQVFAATQEHFVPQMLNLDLSGAVSFRKGCYPGQEVVARMHYLGKARQRMLKASYQTGDSTIAAQPGQSLRDSNGKRLGEVVLASPQVKQLLVSLRLDLLDGDVLLNTANASIALTLDQKGLEQD